MFSHRKPDAVREALRPVLLAAKHRMEARLGLPAPAKTIAHPPAPPVEVHAPLDQRAALKSSGMSSSPE